jgi:hypothetical protein
MLLISLPVLTNFRSRSVRVRSLMSAITVNLRYLGCACIRIFGRCTFYILFGKIYMLFTLCLFGENFLTVLSHVIPA